MRKRIQEEFIQAFKVQDKVKKTLLSVVLGEIKNEESRGKKMDDIAIEKLLRKMSADTSIIIENTHDEEFKNITIREKEILESYLPQLMSEEEIKKEVRLIMLNNSNPNMGIIMKDFNIKFKGKADNNIVSKIVKEELQ